MKTTQARERLQWCGECNRDWPASRWRDSGINYYPRPVTGWQCPKGHITRLCNEGQHDRRTEDGLNWECTRCDAQGLVLPECPHCHSHALVLITPANPGPYGWARRCKDCGHRWDVADEPEPPHR